MKAVRQGEARNIRDLFLFPAVALRHGSWNALNRLCLWCRALILFNDVEHYLLGVVPVAVFDYLSHCLKDLLGFDDYIEAYSLRALKPFRLFQLISKFLIDCSQ